ncbi:hypothetical protein CEXT_282331 [Caerostris extrusa]|uniref:Uncharacterized protein n=1 Tax=Caerostris extrusa TaxID=172846 RepID=A0AAV4Y9L1_CAEEX|nr:hypothetical protein CEXT_282331 [Caerostris extrusa]
MDDDTDHPIFQDVKDLLAWRVKYVLTRQEDDVIGDDVTFMCVLQPIVSSTSQEHKVDSPVLTTFRKSHRFLVEVI